MGPFVLAVLVGAGFWLQHWSDTRRITGVAQELRWSIARIRWAPLARFVSGSRWERCYWLQYRDEKGRVARCLCRIRGFLGLGETLSFDRVSFEAVAAVEAGGAVVRPAARPRTVGERLLLALACAFAGAWVGAAVGIGGAFLTHPGSNVAPAYGVIYGVPIGTIAGALFGFLRFR